MARWLYVLLCALCVNINNTFAQVDTHASPATHQLYTHLLQLYQRGKILFGHQESLEYGVGWQYRPNYSDVYAVIQNLFPLQYAGITIANRSTLGQFGGYFAGRNPHRSCLL